MYNKEEDPQVSRFNDAMLSINRLNDSWVLCKRAIRKGDLKKWKVELDNIFLELITDINRQKDKVDLFKKNEAFMLEIATAKKRQELFFSLYRRHAFLRQMQDLAGKAGDYNSIYEESGL